MKEFLEAIQSKQPPAPKDALAEFESAIGAELPPDYRQFLEKCNGGYVAGEFVFDANEKRTQACPNHIGGFREESHFSLTWTRENYQSEGDVRIPLDLLWIMDDPFGNAICIGLSGTYRGRMYFWDHENEPDPESWDGQVQTAGNVELLSDSFTAFVQGLHRDQTPPTNEGLRSKPWWKFW